MMVAEESGVISFFYTRPHEDLTLRNKCFLKLLNSTPDNILRKIKTINFELIIKAYLKDTNPLTCLNENPQNLICLIGNEDGNIEIYNINEILQKYKIEENHGKKKPFYTEPSESIEIK